MNTQFRKGVIEMCILALIERKDMYGYEIVQSIAYYTEINEGDSLSNFTEVDTRRIFCDLSEGKHSRSRPKVLSYDRKRKGLSWFAQSRLERFFKDGK